METGTLDGELLAGRYRVGELLGRGGMADVYAGVDVRLAREVAVKILRPEMAAQPEVRRRFEEEARSAARLSHPNAVAVFDTGEDRGQPFIVMERLPGETLADRIRQGPMEEARVLGVARDVLAALGAAHGAGLVHRDVKPGNILLAADGRAKVADFGIAKSVEAVGGGHVDLTTTNVLVGTPAYLAPERLDGEPATARSDIWALGAVLFECLSATKPFPGTTPAAVVAAISEGVPLSLRQLCPDVSPSLAGAVERALARRPEDRFRTAGAMAAALGSAVGPASPPTARPAGAMGAEMGAEATLVESLGEPGVAPERPGPLGAPGLVPGGDQGDTRVAPHDAWVPAGGGGWGRLRRRPSWVLAAALAAVAALALALVLVGGGGGGSGHRPPPPRPLSAQIRDVAAGVQAAGAAAGSQGPEAALRLDEVAAAMDAGNGTVQAQALVADVESWQASNELAAPQVGEVLRVLVQVPGVTLEPQPASFSTDTVPPPDHKGHGKNQGNGNQGGGGD